MFVTEHLRIMEINLNFWHYRC